MVLISEAIFSKSWNSNPTLWRHHLKIGCKRLRFVYQVQLVVEKLKSGTIITLIQKFFPDRRNSELWNIDICCDIIMTSTIRVELASKMRLSTSWNYRFWSLLQLANLQESFFKDNCFYRAPLVAHYKRSSILQYTRVIKLWQNSWNKRHAVPLTNIDYAALIFVKFLKNCFHTKTFPLKVLIDLVLIFQIIFDISVWFHFGITLILSSPFAEDMQIWSFFDSVFAIRTSELGLKF